MITPMFVILREVGLASVMLGAAPEPAPNIATEPSIAPAELPAEPVPEVVEVVPVPEVEEVVPEVEVEPDSDLELKSDFAFEPEPEGFIFDGAMPSLRHDSSARFPVASATPIQYSMRLDGGADLFWSANQGLALFLRPSVAYRYDHMPDRNSDAWRHLAEVGASFGMANESDLALAYRPTLVIGTAGFGDNKAMAVGLRQHLELGVGIVDLGLSGIFGVSVSHELLWLPEVEHAILVSASVDVAALVLGVVAIIVLVE